MRHTSSTTASSGAAVNLEVDNPAPVISSLSATTAFAGSGSLVVTVVGTGFLPSTTIDVNGSARTTTYINATEVSAALPLTDFAAAGTLSVTAVNAAPGGGTSAASTISVVNPAPVLQSLAPSVLDVGSTANATITVTGTGFVPSSTVSVSGSSRATTYVSGTSLTFTATVADQATVGSLPVAVTNPAPGGGTSSTVNLNVITPPPTPVITVFYPTSLVVDSGPASLVVYGNGFQTTSVVQWNGASLPTTWAQFYNGVDIVNVLEATVPASDLTTAGTANITVNTPYANPAGSNVETYSIVNPPAPTLTSLSPTSGPINVASTETLLGTGFTSASTVTVNGQTVPSTYVSSTEIDATFPANQLATLGNSSVTVTTPAPGGGTSAALTFTTCVSIPNNSMVYNPANGLFYLSVPSSAGAPYGNSVVSIDPLTGSLGTPILVGSEPDQLAISSDGSILWVALDGASAVRQVDLSTGTAGTQFSLGGNGGMYQNPPKAYALAALPGSPNSVVVATQTPFTYEGTVAIFDSGVLRGTVTSSSINGIYYALLADGSKNEIYAGGPSYQTYTYDATGLKPLATGPSGFTYAANGTNEMQIAGGVLYTDYGRAFDAEFGSLLGTFYASGTTAATGPTVADTTLGLAFILDSSSSSYYGSNNQIQIFNLSNYASAGSSVIPIGAVNTSGTITSYASHLTRWGTNGLAYHSGAGFFSLRSNLVKNLASVNADLGVTLQTSGSSTTGSKATYTATITNNGPSDSTNIAFSSTIPSTSVLISATPSAGTCSVGAAVSCDLGGLANGASATVTIVVSPLSAGTATMTAQVSGSENDPTTSNASREFPRLCRGGSRRLTFPGVHPGNSIA